MATFVFQKQDQGRWFGVLVGITILLAFASLMIGVYSLQWTDIRTDTAELNSQLVLLVSRIPRTLAIILVGASTSISGMIMQMLSRNRFVSPSTAGTVESASLGILIVTLLYPGASIGMKIVVACASASAGRNRYPIP